MKFKFVIVAVFPDKIQDQYWGPFKTEEEAKNYLFEHVLPVMRFAQKKVDTAGFNGSRTPVYAFITYVNYSPTSSVLYTVEED